ncbi:hypothetical protein KFK09_002566 [Dendrobium nobile]|uniref:Uncharacterized protein n=1 Tax=Dendrobium nobile TaxID=94219 RepID=A0A8T3C6Q8_DENNO|nr:hypothetical protein KFK09_002566 [Dendrobium nobile]
MNFHWSFTQRRTSTRCRTPTYQRTFVGLLPDVEFLPFIVFLPDVRILSDIEFIYFVGLLLDANSSPFFGLMSAVSLLPNAVFLPDAGFLHFNSLFNLPPYNGLSDLHLQPTNIRTPQDISKKSGRMGDLRTSLRREGPWRTKGKPQL